MSEVTDAPVRESAAGPRQLQGSHVWYELMTTDPDGATGSRTGHSHRAARTNPRRQRHLIFIAATGPCGQRGWSSTHFKG